MKLTTAALCSVLAALPAMGAERFAVVAGNDTGSPGRARLWFAEKDAQRVAGALEELGDFAPDHVTVLQGASADDVRAALRATEERVVKARAAGERVMLLFYYSGHAGANGLELGAGHLAYGELRALVTGSQADTKVAIVDACDAGRLTQTKGATFSSAVDFVLPSDEVQGTAFIASSSPGEASQESAAIGGSFFTHHLEVALRGAADADGDGQVTLAEAFRYTAVRTTSGTAGTEAGPQHPTYDIRMSGRGDVVLANLRRGEATLQLPGDAHANWILHGPRELLIEVPGSAESTSLALPAGKYMVERRAPDGRARAEILLARADVRLVPPLLPTRYERARSKGGPQPAVIFGGGGVLALGLPHFGIAPAARAGGRVEIGEFGLRFHLDYAQKTVQDLELRYSFWTVGGAAALVYPVLASPVLLELGLEGGYRVASQRVQNTGVSLSRTAGGPQAGMVLQASRSFGPLRLALDISGGAAALKVNDGASVRPQATAALVILFNP